MAKVNSGIDVAVIVVVAFANVATTWAQSEESPRRLREGIRRARFGAGFPSAAAAFDTEVKISPSDSAAGFAGSVAISGDTAIVGASFGDGNETRSGAVYVYYRDEGGGDNWGEVTKITASDGAAFDYFGGSVAISGDTVIVAAPRDFDNGMESGSAYVYQRDKGGKDNWGEVAKITASDGGAGDRFGGSVAISGDTVIVGAASGYPNVPNGGSAYVYRKDEGGPNNWGEVAKINPSESVGGFGYSVAISGDAAIVGAYEDDDNGDYSGSAYVYQRDAGGTDNWGEVVKITASDGASEDYFGLSVAISGDTAIVGAGGDDDNGSTSGAAYVYRRDEGGVNNWGEVTKITASDAAASDFFGGFVAISGDAAIVGSDNDTGLAFGSSGAAYVYRRDEGAVDNWGEVTKLNASEPVSAFGWTVAISAGTAIVGGCWYCNGAFVYFETQVCLDDAACDDGDPCNGAETCNTETSRCLPATPTPCDDGDLCNGVESCDPATGNCIDGELYDCDQNGIDDTCDLIDCDGDPWCDDCDSNGSLDRCDIADGQPDENGDGVPDQCEPCTDTGSCEDSYDAELKLTPSDGASGSGFGGSMAISGDIAIVGAASDDDNGSASGSVYVYRRDEGGVRNWGEVTKITASDAAASDYFGIYVAISGDTVIVGASGDDDNGSSAGAAYVYRRDEGGADNWGEVVKITASDGTADDGFGRSVAISGDTAIVGAYRDDALGTVSGSAYVYRRDEGGVDNWGEVAKLTASDGEALDYFGWSVAISGDTAMVGQSTYFNVGFVYVYRRDAGGVDNWGEVTKITDNVGAAQLAFGHSIAISGDTVIVGAHVDDDTSQSLSASAYLHQREEGGVDNWGQVTNLVASDGANGSGFGQSVAISGDVAIVGDEDNEGNAPYSGSAYVYRRNQGGTDNWGEVTKLIASDGEAHDHLGRSVAISGDTAIVGGCGNCGAVYVYFPTPCTNDAECADGDACNGAETCDTETGDCLPGTPIECDDGDECNGVESCDPRTGDCIDGEFGDCDGNGIDDACELADCGGDPGCDDCNGNGSLDRCDIAGGQPDVNGNAVPDQCESCTDNAFCDDSSPCSFDQCIDGVCSYDVDVRYGDVAGEAGVCGPDGDVGLSDILAVLDGFAGQYAKECELVNIDIAGDAGSCVPNDGIDLSDILGVLDAFQGQDRCCAATRE